MIMEAPELYEGNYCSSSQCLPEKATGGDHFAVEDLLDFSNAEDVGNDGIVFETVAETDSSSPDTVLGTTSNSSSFSGCEPNFTGDIGCGNFAGDICVPYDDLAELEWLSNFVEDSFSSDDLEKLQLISGVKARPEKSSETGEFHPELNRIIPNPTGAIIEDMNPIFNPDMSVPAKARSKRRRSAPEDWTSRLRVLKPSTATAAAAAAAATWSSSESELIVPAQQSPLLPAVHSTTGKKTVKIFAPKKKESSTDCGGLSNGEGRRCLHCATDKTPQWRTGPMGPKTLCNACGVRYKSGRLVPEYRPAASPTFVLTKHSNSHRKVLELRRQKEVMKSHQHPQHQLLHHHHHRHHHHHHPSMMFDVSNGDDYLIHQHVGPDYRQLI